MTGKTTTRDEANRYFAALSFVPVVGLLDNAITRNGDRLVVNQGQLPMRGHNSCGTVLDFMGKEIDIETLG